MFSQRISFKRPEDPCAKAFEVCDVAGDDDEVVNQRGHGYQGILVNRIRPPLHEAGVASENGGVGKDDGERVFEFVGPNFEVSRALAGSRAGVNSTPRWISPSVTAQIRRLVFNTEFNRRPLRRAAGRGEVPIRRSCRARTRLIRIR
jgi:hypothetical protein